MAVMSDWLWVGHSEPLRMTSSSSVPTLSVPILLGPQWKDVFKYTFLSYPWVRKHKTNKQTKNTMYSMATAQVITASELFADVLVDTWCRVHASSLTWIKLHVRRRMQMNDHLGVCCPIVRSSRARGRQSTLQQRWWWCATCAFTTQALDLALYSHEFFLLLSYTCGAS